MTHPTIPELGPVTDREYLIYLDLLLDLEKCTPRERKLLANHERSSPEQQSLIEVVAYFVSAKKKSKCLTAKLHDLAWSIALLPTLR